MIEAPSEGGVCGAFGTLAVYLGRGTATLEFALPEEASDAQISEVMLSIRSEEGWGQPPSMALYDWHTGSWTELSAPVFGDNIVTNTESLVSKAGMLRVRLSAESKARVGCLYVGLGVKGAR
jgi:hypothetical protein